MCYSAQIWADYKRYKRAYGSEIDIATFAELFWSRLDNPKIIIPKAVQSSRYWPRAEVAVQSP